MAQTAQPQQVLTASELAALTPAERANYFSSLPPDTAAGEQAAYGAFVDQANAQFMALAVKKKAPMIPAGGGITSTYAPGNALTYDFPTAGGAWAEAIIVTVNLQLVFAAGTGATYGLNQLAPLTLFDRCQVLLNGVQHNFRPYILKYLGQFRRFSGLPEPTTVLSGNKDATIESKLNSGGTYSVAVGTQTWAFKFRIPLNVLNDENPAGMLPMMSAGTKPQLVLTCAPALLGNDPILNIVRATGGSGNAVTIGATATVQCDVEYRDGTNLWTPTALGLDLTDVPTVQFIEDTQFNNIVAGTVQRSRITTLLQHYLVLDAIVDATTAGQLVSGLANIQSLEVDMDSVGQNKFFAFGTGTNMDIYDFYENLRRQYGFDVDEGIIPLVVGWSQHNTNPDNRNGQAVLNMMVGGWPDVNTGYLLGAVTGAAGVVPRVDRHVVSLNPAGLKLVQA